jgi:hypothetical protein
MVKGPMPSLRWLHGGLFTVPLWVPTQDSSFDMRQRLPNNKLRVVSRKATTFWMGRPESTFMAGVILIGLLPLTWIGGMDGAKTGQQVRLWLRALEQHAELQVVQGGRREQMRLLLQFQSGKVAPSRWWEWYPSICRSLSRHDEYPAVNRGKF